MSDRSLRTILAGVPTPVTTGAGTLRAPQGGDIDPLEEPPLPGHPELLDFLLQLQKGKFLLPQWQWPRRMEMRPFLPPPKPRPRIYLVEEYEVVSKLGDYGVGKTVRTYTLLPGETSEISIETWRTDRVASSRASSIFDSFSSSAAQRFSDQIASETGSRTGLSESEQRNFHVGGKVWGWFAVAGFEVDSGYSSVAQKTASFEDFKRSMSSAISEHANESNSLRETSVASTAEQTSESGERTRNLRVLRNVNLRRVLNFVFRELNQEYIAEVRLVDIRVGFDNGNLESYREASLSQLRSFLNSLLAANHVDGACKKVLNAAAYVYDVDDTPVLVLEAVTISADGATIKVEPAKRGRGGGYKAPDEGLHYRFRPAAVVTTRTTEVLRTDSLIVEALLGQSDALDQYAMDVQAADSRSKLASAGREEMTNQALGTLNGQNRVDALEKLYGPGDGVLQVSLIQP